MLLTSTKLKQDLLLVVITVSPTRHHQDKFFLNLGLQPTFYQYEMSMSMP